MRAEAAAEVLASYVGRQLALPVPEAELVQFHGELCALLWDFTSRFKDLREGVDLTESLPVQGRVSLDEVQKALETHFGAEESRKHVIHMVCFDILIGNPDRHQRNWGILKPTVPDGASHMAPYYDHGGAFGSILDPEKVRTYLESDWESFDRGFKYEIVVSRSSRSKARIPELLSVLRSWDSELAGFDEKLEGLFTDDIIDQLCATIPLSAFDVDRREFARRLLLRRRDLIRRC